MKKANSIVSNTLKANRIIANTSKNIPRQQVNIRTRKQKLSNMGPTNQQRKNAHTNTVKKYFNKFNTNVNTWIKTHEPTNNNKFNKNVTLALQNYQTEKIISEIPNNKTENRQKMLNSMRNQTFLKRLIAQMIYNQQFNKKNK